MVITSGLKRLRARCSYDPNLLITYDRLHSEEIVRELFEVVSLGVTTENTEYTEFH